MKSVVVYYSNSGNTQKIAEAIGARFGAELRFVAPAQPYGGFLSAVARVVREHRGANDPAFKEPPADLSGFDLIFLGFPVWAGEMPRFMRAYVRGCNLAGKTVVPFATAMGTGRDSALESVRALLPDSKIEDYFYTSLREKAGASAWLDGLAAKYAGKS